MKKLIRRVVIFLVRKNLGLKAYEGFRFVNQKSESDWYLFTDDEVLKVSGNDTYIWPSHVSLNWLLNDNCEIVKIDTDKKKFKLRRKRMCVGV